MYMPTHKNHIGKWYPPRWPVYILYKCEHTWFTDDYLQFFAGSGKELDQSKSKIRANQQKIDSDKNDCSHKKRLVNLDNNRGMDIVETQTSAKVLLNQSSDIYERLTDSICIHQMNLENTDKELKMAGKSWKSSMLIQNLWNHPVRTMNF